MIKRITLLSLLLMMPLTSHAGFTTGFIVGHVMTDKSGGSQSYASPKARSYDATKVIDCTDYQPLTKLCKLPYKIDGDSNMKSNYYSVMYLAQKYLKISDPKIKFIHEYEYDWLVEFE